MRLRLSGCGAVAIKQNAVRAQRGLIETVHSRVVLVHGAAAIVRERAGCAGDIVAPSLACSIDIGSRGQIRLRRSRRYRYAYEPIAKQPGTSDCEFGSRRDLG